MKLILALIILAMNSPAVADNLLFTCTHPEICKMLASIIKESQLDNTHFSNAILPIGDPHEYEPSSKEIKQLIQAKIIITGPKELNPWMEKIESQRKNKDDIHISLDRKFIEQYQGASTESLSHFWLYPDIYCSFKQALEQELKIKSIKIKSVPCEVEPIKKQLENVLSGLKIPIIVTHDALVPLIKKMRKNSNDIAAIKGSSHHDEASVGSIKKAYDLLKNPRVLWILENDIVIPSNITSKIRPNDLVIKLDSKSKFESEPFYQLSQLINELRKIK